MRELSFPVLCQMLAEPKKTLILCHARPDGDAIGSAFALKVILQIKGSEAYCASADEVPKRLRFLTTSIQSGSMTAPMPEDFLPERIITVDTPSLAQLGAPGVMFGDNITLMIDHHKAATPYAPAYIDPNAAAAGEIVYRIADALLSAHGIPFPMDLCRCLYAAISSDTGGFRYSNVTPTTHMIAGSLIKSGVDAAEINRLLFDCKTPARLLAERVALENLKFCCEGKIAFSTISYEEILKKGLAPEELDVFVEAARSVAGVEIAFSVRQMTPGDEYRFSVRSNGKADVAAICTAFGGGGHIKAAGCSLRAPSMEVAVETFLREAVKQL